MSKEYEYRECARCEFIEDCPHPGVDMEGKPIPPIYCSKKEQINLKQRSDYGNQRIDMD